MTKRWSLMAILALRERPVGFGSAARTIVPSPCPLLGSRTSQGTSLVADHAQSRAVVSCALTCAPPDGTGGEVRLIWHRVAPPEGPTTEDLVLPPQADTKMRDNESDTIARMVLPHNRVASRGEPTAERRM